MSGPPSVYAIVYIGGLSKSTVYYSWYQAEEKGREHTICNRCFTISIVGV